MLWKISEAPVCICVQESCDTGLNNPIQSGIGMCHGECVALYETDGRQKQSTKPMLRMCQ